MFSNRFISLLICAFVLGACSVSKRTAEKPIVINLDTLVVKEKEKQPLVYRASPTRINDILHTRVEVSFDWNKKYLFGKATLTIKPYFYPTAVLDLDARGMEIKQVTLLNAGVEKKLEYTYTDNVIHVNLDKTYQNNEEYRIFVEYISKPDELQKGGSEAIRDDRGLYFINPDGSDKEKPQQIWTQGETQATSVWMPTIDKPNEKMTQEVIITTEDKYVTLSNGVLISVSNNGNGTHTDYWKMDLPLSPYLAMMAIGDFAIVKDKWRDKEVNYYVEKKYEPYARNTFGNTAEMMEFFSKKLGVDYPWNKYSQVVVRDYISGAMENTSATLLGEFMNRTDRELLYEDYEYVISHELFHQWFGDLATIESWSNLPLNESFATYGEYLWCEYKYGKDAADEHSQESREQYLVEALHKQEPLIRYYYDDREALFDRHSYNKGGQVLHMLRKYVGDEAFFASLKLYLETNLYKSVEIHQLRLAFEQVTGEDLNWFFNEWFLSPGHPELTIATSYDETTKKVKIEIKQTQDQTKTPVFEIPMYVDIYSKGTVDRKKIRVEKAMQEFYFDADQKPDLVNVDAEKMLLCKKTETKSKAEWGFQYMHAPLYLDRYEALANLSANSKDSLSTRIIIAALDDKFWSLRKMAISALKSGKPGYETEIKNKLITIVKSDDKAMVREAALDYLSANYKDESLNEVYQQALKDRSFEVIGSGLLALAKTNPEAALASAKELEKDENLSLSTAIMRVYVKYGSAENNAFFIKTADLYKVYYVRQFIGGYGAFLSKLRDYSTVNSGIIFLIDYVKDNKTNPFAKDYVKAAIKDIQTQLDKRIKEGSEKLKTKDASQMDEADKRIQEQITKDETEKQKVIAFYNDVK
ncbi:MAG TPA: M1 family aminopeptidase [Bacteroidia bacterium]|nr:M1 family aminopeptidase [Bacteroidia bacterium]